MYLHVGTRTATLLGEHLLWRCRAAAGGLGCMGNMIFFVLIWVVIWYKHHFTMLRDHAEVGDSVRKKS